MKSSISELSFIEKMFIAKEVQGTLGGGLYTAAWFGLMLLVAILSPPWYIAIPVLLLGWYTIDHTVSYLMKREVMREMDRQE